MPAHYDHQAGLTNEKAFFFIRSIYPSYYIVIVASGHELRVEYYMTISHLNHFDLMFLSMTCEIVFFFFIPFDLIFLLFRMVFRRFDFQKRLFNIKISIDSFTKHQTYPPTTLYRAARRCFYPSASWMYILYFFIPIIREAAQTKGTSRASW